MIQCYFATLSQSEEHADTFRVPSLSVSLVSVDSAQSTLIRHSVAIFLKCSWFDTPPVYYNTGFCGRAPCARPLDSEP